jgi:hypothetical protein
MHVHGVRPRAQLKQSGVGRVHSTVSIQLTLCLCATRTFSRPAYAGDVKVETLSFLLELWAFEVPAAACTTQKAPL